MAGGTLLALYGLVALAYRHEGDSNTYVTLGSSRLGAHLVGGSALALGIAAIVFAAGLARGKFGRS
jgi:hypothetical protein